MRSFDKPALKRLDRLLKSLHLLFRKFPRVTVALAALAFCLGIAGLTHLRQLIRIEDQLDMNFESARDLAKMQNLFPRDPTVEAVFHSSHAGGFSQDELCKLRRSIDLIPFSLVDAGVATSTFTLREAAADSRSLNYPRLIGDPCDVSFLGLQKLKNTLWNGLYTDRDARDVVAEFYVAPLTKPGRWGTLNAKATDQLLNYFKPLTFAKTEWFGQGIQDNDMLKGIEQSNILNVVMALLVLLTFRFFFGTWKSGLIFLGTLVFAGVTCFGAMGAAGHTLDFLAISLFLMLALASLEDFVFLSYLQTVKSESTRRHFIRLVTPSFFTSLTTVIGFGSLCISKLTIVRHFGLWAATGAAIEWIAIFLVLPSVMKVFFREPIWTSPTKARMIASANRFATYSVPRAVMWIMILVFPLSVGFAPSLKLQQDPTRAFPPNHPLREASRYLDATRGWRSSAFLLLAPDLSVEKKEAILERVTATPSVAKVLSFPSLLQEMKRTIHDDKLKRLVTSEIENSPVAERFNAETGESRAVVYLSTTNSSAVDKLRKQIRELCPKGECSLAGDIVAFADFSQQFIVTLFESFFLSLLLVSAVIAFLVRSTGIPRLAPFLVSSFWGPAALLGSIGAFGIEVNSVTCVVASTLVGLTGDNAIQFIFSNYRAKKKNGPANELCRGIETMGGGSFQCAVAMAVASFVFLGSYFEPPRVLALLLISGFLLSLLGDVCLLRTLLETAGRGAVTEIPPREQPVTSPGLESRPNADS